MDKLQKYKPTDKMIDLIGDNYSFTSYEPVWTVAGVW